MSETDAQMELGVIGVSEGNGHPYSWAAIVNGYSDRGFAKSEWAVIHDYLSEKDPSEFGFPGVRVTHAWTQDPAETEILCSAANIPNAAASRDELLELDGILLLRDDYEQHLEMARPFLESGVPTFVDKPLTLAVEELATFKPYLKSGLLMSCSGMRFARELDRPRCNLESYGDLRLLRGSVPNDWARYGVHVLEAVLGVIEARPTAVTALPGELASISIETTADYRIQIDALGDIPLVFGVDIYGSDRVTHHHLSDNFRAFRRTLWHFIHGIRTGEPPIPVESTLDVIRVLCAGRLAMGEHQRVELDELDV